MVSRERREKMIPPEAKGRRLKACTTIQRKGTFEWQWDKINGAGHTLNNGDI